jgi:hypothetical protein
VSKENNVIQFPVPQQPMTKDDVRAVWDFLMEIMHSDAARLLNVHAAVAVPNEVAERFMSTKKRHDYVYEPVVIGRVMGWRCYDPDHYDGDPADGDTSCGYGLTETDAYLDYNGGLPATAAERELDEAIDEALDFDCDLEDRA